MIKLNIIYNKDKEDAIKIYKELLKYLKAKKKFEILDDKNLSQAEYMVVIGGDGSYRGANLLYKESYPLSITCFFLEVLKI